MNKNYELEKMTQEQIVLKHLQDFGSITSWEAFVEYGISRLSARILNLRKDGWIIDTDYVTRKNRYNRLVTFGKYTLKGNIHINQPLEIEV